MPCRHFGLSNLTTVLSLCLKTSTKSHHTPFASAFYGLPFCDHPASTLIKIPSGRSKLAPISASALKFPLGRVQNEPAILFYLLSIIFDGLYSSHNTTVCLPRDSVTFTVCWQFVGKPSHLWCCGWLMSLSAHCYHLKEGYGLSELHWFIHLKLQACWGIFHKKITPG